jgi:hypothetical protein
MKSQRFRFDYARAAARDSLRPAASVESCRFGELPESRLS